MSKYRYTIINRLGTFSALPLGEADFVINWTRETGGLRDYKQELPSKAIFRNEIYQSLYTLEQSIYRCDYNTLIIERNCTASGVEVWSTWLTGRFIFNEATWNLDRCEVEIKLQDAKPYQCIEDNKGKEYDLFSILPRRTVLMNATNITIETVDYSISGEGGSTECNASIYWGGAGDPYTQGWVLYSNRHEVQLDSGGHCEILSRWARETIEIPCGEPSPGSEWILVDDTCPGGVQKYARQARLYGCVYTMPDYTSSVQVDEYNCNIVGATVGNVSLDNGLSLENVMAYFLSQMCPGMTFVSNFFQINPDVPSVNNYVTGQRSKTRFLTLFQKSDVKRPNAINSATKAPLAFEKLVEALVNCYNLEYRIEGGGTIFRMEHVSFFNKTAGLDLTLPRYANFVAGKRKYSYDSEEIPSREEFKFMEASSGDFQGVPIYYTGGCVSKGSKDNVKTYTADKITTDVELVLSNPQPDSKVVADEGFVLIAADYDGADYFIITESPIFSGSTINNSLAWAQLHRDYHRYNRPLPQGIMNGVDTTFISVKPNKRGDKITVPLCCDDVFNPDQTIKTALGVGIVDKATFSFKHETIELELLYPANQGLTGNIPPEAVGEVVFTYLNTPLLINVLANDYDPDGVITAVEIVSPPLNGTAIVTSDRKILYTPATGYEGDDLLTYRVRDNWNEPSGSALIAIDVLGANTPPVATNDSYFTDQNTALVVGAPGVFANDSDNVGFTLNAFDAASANGGTVAINADGSFTYTPATGYVGFDTFTYQIIDADGLTDNATVTVDVRNPNNPVAADDPDYLTKRNLNLSIAAPGLLANDTTTIGTLSAVAGTFGTAQGGSVAVAADGGFVYTPPSGFSGVDTFTYTASNGTGTDTATATVRVLPDIYVSLEQVDMLDESLTQECGGFSTDAGNRQTATFQVKFFSNSAGTVAFDVTGLNLPVHLRVIGGYYSSSGTYENDTTIIGAGTQTVFLSNYIYYIFQYDCSGNMESYKNETIIILPGLYTVI